MDFKTFRQKSISPSRRRFIQGASSVLALPLLGCGGGGSPRPLVADTSSGVLSGEVSGQIASYKGIPYAQAPVGALRFKANKSATNPLAGIIISAAAVSPMTMQNVQHQPRIDHGKFSC